MKLIKGKHYSFKYRGEIYFHVKYRGVTWTTFGHLCNFALSRGFIKIPKDDLKLLDIREH